VRLAVREQKWEVTNEVWLSTFSFESLVIYQDLRTLTDLATANPIVVALSGAAPTVGKSEALPQGLDSLPIPATVPIPVLPTDSSQLEALTQSALGRHVVVHGPPGTGKSQINREPYRRRLSSQQEGTFRERENGRAECCL
jgi:hypothetical protein